MVRIKSFRSHRRLEKENRSQNSIAIINHIRVGYVIMNKGFNYSIFIPFIFINVQQKHRYKFTNIVLSIVIIKMNKYLKKKLRSNMKRININAYIINHIILKITICI